MLLLADTLMRIENYMQNERGVPSVPGALGLGQSTASAISNVFFVFQFLTPLLFAIISDIRLGRYKTLLLGLWYVEKIWYRLKSSTADPSIFISAYHYAAIWSCSQRHYPYL
jgi:dipeptide/tripeptide permease